MIRLHAPSLPTETDRNLRALQSDIDANLSYEQRVLEAKRLWPLKNHSSSSTFKIIRDALSQMCSGHRRCCYCEDSCADEVEHIFPKDLYPEKVFSWDNYLYVCGICNVEKRNDFAVFTNSTGPQITDVKRTAGAAVIPPIAGECVIVNPRIEDPSDFLILDLTGTFLYMPIGLTNDRAKKRANYTCDTLKLNNRDYLVKGRQSAFGACRAILREYVDLRDSGAGAHELNLSIANILGQPHSTVWSEMKRWHLKGRLAHDPAMATLEASFVAAPEALDW